MKKNQEKIEYYLFDAKGQILGRLATKIARILSGKNLVDYTPNIGGKDWVVIINSDKVRLSGEKGGKKIYWRHSGYPGAIYNRTFDEWMEKDSTEVVKHAIKGMLPKNKLSREALKRLRIFKGAEHDYVEKITKEEK